MAMERKILEMEKLEQLLRQMPEREVPTGLHERIMDQVLAAHQPRTLVGRIRQWWQGLPALRVQPLRLAMSAGIAVAAFWLGTVVGGGDQVRITEPDSEAMKLAPFTDSARANYLVGRGLLEAGEQHLALEFIHQALLQEPGSAEYGTWQGLTYWQLGDREKERQSYQQSLVRQPDYIPALLNLGHNLLESGDYRKSLHLYEKVLRINPYEQTALYNRALSYHQLKDPAEEQKAYIQYLDQYRSDKWAYRAVGHLQHLGIFDYRICQIGNRKVVVNQRTLLGPAIPARQLELERLARMVEKAPASALHLVVYLHNDKIQGKAIATELRQQLQAIMEKNTTIPIQVSWFDEPALIQTADGSERELAQGLLIFTQPLTIQRGKV
jgi:tetratricopeptide (TPR) repeat protein